MTGLKRLPSSVFPDLSVNGGGASLNGQGRGSPSLREHRFFRLLFHTLSQATGARENWGREGYGGRKGVKRERNAKC